MKSYDLVIVGGGPAGLAAALSAWESGVRNMVIIERDEHLGGILQQCIHNGFGLHTFGEELTGPEYAWRYIDRVMEAGIPYMLSTIVLDVGSDKVLTVMNSTYGIHTIEAKTVILAMGCRERSRGALNIPGSRPAGIYTAGTAQRFVNIKGDMPGRDVVILGSGDIGLIMARRMTLEGAKVHMVCELMPYSSGLNRNIVQCLEDYNIPLKLSHTVSAIHGDDRITGVTVSKVDENLKVIPEESEYVPCDTLLLSCGLIPENELTRAAGIDIDPVTSGAAVNERRETSVPGIFACGNVLHVHDLVDFVSEEAALAGKSAAEFISGAGFEKNPEGATALRASGGIRYTVPQRIEDKSGDVKIYFRVGRVIDNAWVVLKSGGEVLFRRRRQKMTPGEMESIVLKADVVAKLGEEAELTVERAGD